MKSTLEWGNISVPCVLCGKAVRSICCTQVKERTFRALAQYAYDAMCLECAIEYGITEFNIPACHQGKAAYPNEDRWTTEPYLGQWPADCPQCGHSRREDGKYPMSSFQWHNEAHCHCCGHVVPWVSAHKTYISRA